MNGPGPDAPRIPATQHAIQIVDAGRTVHNRAKAVPVPGPHQILVKMEAVGICFSDTKLLHAFTSHPRKSEVLSGLAPEVLAEIPSYAPGTLPVVPGHEPVGRIVVVGDKVRRHRVGERCLIQTDYRHLPTAAANAAFGYNFDGGLQEYVLLDERMIIEPGTEERFLIPVAEEAGASAVALVEPWACVEASYVYVERREPLREGRLLVVADAGRRLDGIGALMEKAESRAVTTLVADSGQRGAFAALAATGFVDGDLAPLRDCVPAPLVATARLVLPPALRTGTTSLVTRTFWPGTSASLVMPFQDFNSCAVTPYRAAMTVNRSPRLAV